MTRGPRESSPAGGRRRALAAPPHRRKGAVRFPRAGSPEARAWFARLAPGTIVACDVVVWHFGIVSDRRGPDGLPLVISCSRRSGCALEEPWSVFAPGGSGIAVVGYPSRLPARTVLARARAELGRAWLPTDNCESFALRAHGWEGSPTAELVTGAAGAILQALALVV